MIKHVDILEAAYNDAQNVTAGFNKNILNAVNAQLQANFQISNFEHRAFFNEKQGRIEMYLEAVRDCSVQIKALGLDVHIKKGEMIHTENSKKFTIEEIMDVADQAELQIVQMFSDEKSWFSLVEFNAKRFHTSNLN